MTTQVDYTYNASALCLGGEFKRGGIRHVIPSIASVALSPTGGQGSAVERGYSRDGISFTEAISTVNGFATGENAFTTIVSIYISNLTLFDELHIALLTANVTSTRDLNDDTKPEGSFEVNATYHGIELATGGEVIPRVDFKIGSLPRYEEFAKRIRASLPRITSDKKELTLIDGAIRRREPLSTSIVPDYAHRAGPGEALEQRPGNKLDIAKLGRVHFGELIVKPGRRRLNLLRVKFGNDGLATFEENDDSGGVTVGSGDGNGSPIWPRQ